MTFNIPKEIDEFFYVQFVCFFLIGFMMNVYSNGQATLIFVEDYYQINPLIDNQNNSYFENNFMQNQKEDMIQKYTNQTYFNSNLARNLSLILYWLISPLICFYFAIFRFRNIQYLKP
jgi:hypothetical protein